MSGFSSRWALLAATLGMAIGTGNVWRFPRILAKNGGGTFLIPWLVFLFAWSIPLLAVEFGLGRGTRRGPYGAFAKAFGERAAWRGGFVAFCTLFIMFYYSVVAGWTVRYLALAIGGGMAELQAADAETFFTDFAGSWAPAGYHLVAIGIACLVVARGIAGGIERVCRILVPALFVALAISAVRSLSLRGAGEGVDFLFSVDWERLGDHKVWLEALSQSAWSTGAGWGLMLCYAAYASSGTRAVRESVFTGVGNNAASLLAALAIIPAVFALAPMAGEDPAALVGEAGPANTGLTFIWMPVLFRMMPWGGGALAIVFFVGLAFAALSSMIAMVELGVRTLEDLGHRRRNAVVLTFVAGFVLGLPSAVDLPFVEGHTGLGFFENQDWVWGLGLVVSGGFLAFSVLGYGARRFWDEYVSGPDGTQGGALHALLRFTAAVLVPLQFVGLLGWWFWQAWEWVPATDVLDRERPLDARLADWLDPFDTFSVGTCLLQWGVLIALLVVFNRKLGSRAAR